MALPHHVVLLSFEGPDRYATVGGLSTRVSQLARAFGANGCAVDLIFAGDPAAAAIEVGEENVTLRRWSQWISASYPRNAYDGEERKVLDWEASVPGFVVDSIVVPASAVGERTLVLCEEWQTAKATIAIDRLTRERGVRNALTLMWNANGTNGWDRIDWPTLQAAATITAVSKHLKNALLHRGVSAVVIPSGFDMRLHGRADPKLVAEVQQALGGRPTLLKVGRFEPDRNWMQAVDALAELHASGVDARLIVRGRRNAHADAIFAHAYERGLSIERIEYEGRDNHKLIEGLALSTRDIVYITAFLNEAMLSALYAATDAVLANRGREPFGLIGLEVIAAGGVVVCGRGGEEYGESFVNAIVCDTSDGRQLAIALRALMANPDAAEKLRRASAETTERYSWTHALAELERAAGAENAALA